jgi:phosphatidate cytidylyltransferase
MSWLPDEPLTRLHLAWVAAGLAGVLTTGSAAGWLLARGTPSPGRLKLAGDVSARTRAWWVMTAVAFAALWFGAIAACVLFGLLSFLALREFITLAPTRRGDHHTLFWAFFVIVPLQYVFVGTAWFGMFAVFIPVWCFLFVAMRSTLSGDATRYLERTAKIQWGLMLCVFCVSHVPALFLLDLPGFGGRHAELALWLLVVVQLSDVLQYVWGKAIGRHRVAPHLSPNKTWEGLIGGVASASAIGAGLWWLTPYPPWQAFAFAAAATLCGFAGGIVMSAIKRDAGVKDFGQLLPGHGGILDRIDSLSFAAPVVFHATRWYLSP